MDEKNQESPSSRNRFDLDFEPIHSAINPADVRSEDRIFGRLRIRGGVESFKQVQIWRISPLGVEIVNDKEAFPEIQKGIAIDLELTLSGERREFTGLVVDLIQSNQHIELIGVRLSANDQSRQETGDRRQATRWICSEEFYPTCIAPSPTRINDFMYFHIRDISADGLLLVCSLRNKFLIPQTTFQITANFPFVGHFVAPVEVARVGFTTFHGSDRLAVGVKFLQSNNHVRKILSQYLIQFSSASSLQELRDEGLVPSSVGDAIDFYSLKSEEDYHSVLRLRLLAHQDSGNLATDTPSFLDMGDMYDAQARIIVAKHKGEVVATCRVRFNNLDQPLEHEAHVEWPASLPRRDQIVEISRACTHPDFRRSDLLTRLFEFVCNTGVQLERPWVLIGSWESMVGFYKKLGWSETGLSHTEELWKEPQHLLLANSIDVLKGRNVNPFYWNLIWRNAADHAITCGLIHPTGIDKLRLTIYKLLKPLTQLLMTRRLSKRRDKNN